MKIARIVLTATILLSLKSTLFCSAKEVTTTEASDIIQAPRLDSFDPVRDGGALNGWLGYSPDALAEYTLENPGQIHKGKQIRMGKGARSTSFWENFGRTKVTTLPVAQQFVRGAEFAGQTYSEEAMQPARTLIATEHQRLEFLRVAELERVAAIKKADIAQADGSYQSLNGASKAILHAHHERITATRPCEDTATCEKYKAMFRAEKAHIATLREEEDRTIVSSLMTNFTRMGQVTEELKAKYSDAAIRRQAFAQQSELTTDKLPDLANRYKTWQPKSFAQITAGGSVSSEIDSSK